MTTVLYHSADYDGIFCREIAKKFLGEKDVTYIGWNFGDPPVPVPDKGEGDLIVMDLPLDKPFGWPMPLIHLRGGATLTWIDHHKSSIEATPKDIPGYRIDGVAACRLAWQWFKLDSEDSIGMNLRLPDKDKFIARQVSEPLAVRLAGEYDVWDKRDPDAATFQYGLRCLEPNRDVWDALLTIGCVGERNVSSILRDGTAAQGYARNVDAANMKASFLVEWEGLKLLCLNGRGNSLTFASRDIPETGHDALLMFYYNGGPWIVSLYHAKHRTDLDLSQIAVKHGGGGHRGACGFTCSKLPFMS